MGDALTQQVTLTIADKKTIADHPELHHYTTENGFKGIVTKNTLWATHFSDLNDATEVRLLKEPLADALSNRFKKIVREHQSGSLRIRREVIKRGGLQAVAAGLANGLSDSLYKVTFDTTEGFDFGVPFISAFCSHAHDQAYEREHGLLSQWRGYGRDGGYCIVLDAEKLSELLVKEFDSHHYVHMNVCVARYALDGVSIEQMFPELLDRCELFVSEVLKGNMAPSAEDGFAPFVAGATAFKHQGFREEREVRIVAMPGTQSLHDQIRKDHQEFTLMPIKQTNVVESERGQRRYISLFETLKAILPIKRVIVGPSRHQDANMANARELTGNKIAINASATPYIG